jgi:hypothetical protein
MVNLTTTAGQTDLHESSQQTEINNLDKKWMKKLESPHLINSNY